MVTKDESPMEWANGLLEKAFGDSNNKEVKKSGDDKMIKAYVLGDMLKQGSIIMREKEAEALRKAGYDVYSAIEEKDINDKSAVTENENNKLAEKIFSKDSDAIRKSKFILAEVDNNNVGSCVEIGQIAEFNWWYDKISKICEAGEGYVDRGYETLAGIETTNELRKLLDKYPKKEMVFHTSDIRHTNIKEAGYRRSFSFNQYLVGACLSINPDGIITTQEALEKLKPNKEKKYVKVKGTRGMCEGCVFASDLGSCLPCNENHIYMEVYDE